MSARMFRLSLACAATVACSGCMSLYKLPAGAPHTRVELPKGVTSWICADDEPHILSRSPEGIAVIPTGKRVVLGANFASSDGYMQYFCSASISLIPRQGTDYLQDFVIEGDRCSALVYRVDPDNARVGLALDPTVRNDTLPCIPGGKSSGK